MNKINKLGRYDLICESGRIYLTEWNGGFYFAQECVESIGKRIEEEEFTMEISYPFERPLKKKFKLDLYRFFDLYYINTNKIIDIILEMLQEMYKTTEKETEIENLPNQYSKSSTYGKCYHHIADLWLEELIIDLKSHTITPFIGS